MKRFYIIVFILAGLAMGSQCQVSDFEGIITYAIDYSANADPGKAAQLKHLFGDSVRIYTRGNDYKQHYIHSNYIQEVTYLGKANKYYLVFSKFDTVYSVDCAVADDQYAVRTLPYMQELILGHQCVELEMEGEKSTKTYYYAPDLPLKNADFSEHKMGGFDLYAKNAQSMFLYLKIGNANGVQELKAVSIQYMKLPDSVFELLPLPIK